MHLVKVSGLRVDAPTSKAQLPQPNSLKSRSQLWPIDFSCTGHSASISIQNASQRCFPEDLIRYDLANAQEHDGKRIKTHAMGRSHGMLAALVNVGQKFSRT